MGHEPPPAGIGIGEWTASRGAALRSCRLVWGREQPGAFAAAAARASRKAAEDKRMNMILAWPKCMADLHGETSLLRRSRYGNLHLV